MDPDPTERVLRVKRYANRKIYVPENKSYTNLRGLYEVLLAGRDVHVTCVRTGRDVTTLVLGAVYQAMCVETGYVAAVTLMERIRRDGPTLANLE